MVFSLYCNRFWPHIFHWFCFFYWNIVRQRIRIVCRLKPIAIITLDLQTGLLNVKTHNFRSNVMTIVVECWPCSFIGQCVRVSSTRWRVLCRQYLIVIVIEVRDMWRIQAYCWGVRSETKQACLPSSTFWVGTRSCLLLNLRLGTPFLCITV